MRSLSPERDQSTRAHRTLADALFLAGGALIVGTFCAQLGAGVGFFLGVPVGPLHLVIYVLSAAAFLLVGRPQGSVLAIGISAALLVCSVAIGTLAHDFSVDGQNYHQQAMIELARGWNPVLDSPVEGKEALWVNSYAKGPWVTGTMAFALTGNIEAGKAWNFVFAGAAWLIVAGTILRLRVSSSMVLAAVVAFVVVVNPVWIYQAFTNYVDGQLSALGAIFLVLAVRLGIEYDSRSAIVLATVVGLAANVKFTGLVYAIAGLLVLLVYLLFSRERTRVMWVALLAGSAIACATLVIGFNPYISNTIRYGNPFYPLAGAHHVDIITSNVSPDFAERSRSAKLFLSIFSRSHSLVPEDQTVGQITLKPPFRVYADELRYFFSRTDIRIGGFGPLFSAMVVLSIGILAGLLARRVTRRTGVAAFMICGAIVLVSLINPEAWWARYAPQIWLVPLVVAVAGLIAVEVPYLIRAASVLTVLVCVANVGLIAVLAFSHVAISELSLRSQLTTLAGLSKSHEVTVRLDADSNRLRLDEFAVRYNKVENLGCNEPIQVVNSKSYFCIEGDPVTQADLESPLVVHAKRMLGWQGWSR